MQSCIVAKVMPKVVSFRLALTVPSKIGARLLDQSYSLMDLPSMSLLCTYRCMDTCAMTWTGTYSTRISLYSCGIAASSARFLETGAHPRNTGVPWTEKLYHQ